MTPVTAFWYGAIAMGCWVAGLFFLRFWRATRDRLFAFFAAAFWLLAAERVALVAVAVDESTRHYFFFLRLAAFVLIIIGIADKNRHA
ncbi:MAG TPA: DUF5985 family protein [Vicinamibacterales bacterium]|jgi:hypothetical protein